MLVSANKKPDKLECAVLAFANAMLKKLRRKQRQGKSGWDSDDWVKYGHWLSSFEGHVDKLKIALRHDLSRIGDDAVDIGNYLMMRWHYEIRNEKD